MIFGAIREDGKRFLSLCSSNVDSNCSQTILDQALPEMYRSRHLFQQDGASCHTSRSTAVKVFECYPIGRQRVLIYL